MNALAEHGLAGGVIGIGLAILVGFLALTWLFLPVLVYQIRNDIKRHLAQQAKMQKAVERLQRDMSGQP